MTILHGNAPLGGAVFARAKDIANPNKHGIARALLATASASVLSISMATGASAQAVPAECTPTTAITGGTIVCIAPAPTVIDGIATTVDDLTVIVGDAATPTSVNEAAGDGINMSGNNGQTLNIVNTGSSVTGSSDGVDIRVTGGVADLTIVSEGTITGGSSGIVASGLFSSADINITTADVTGMSDAGISAYASYDGSVTVDSSAGSVQGETFGIHATGIADITTADVTATSGTAIWVFDSYGSATVDSSAGTVMGGNIGINAVSGAFAVNVTAADVTGGNVGINTNTPAGITTITLGSGANVTGTAAQGIRASSNFAPANITVQGMAGATVTGGTDGLDIDTMGADILVDDLASITGNAGDGIDAVSAGGDITITGVDTILGTGGNGIFANAGAGNISIQDSGLVGGITGTGAVGNITIGASILSNANGSGLVAFSTAGAINIGGTTAIGNVTSDNTIGILAQTTNGGITLDSSAGTVTGGDFGIVTREYGAGAISIISADVTGAASAGIDARSVDGAITVDSSAGTVTGGDNGIYAITNGADAISITSADATGTSFDGIYASSNGGAITVDSSAGTVTGGYAGIYAITYGAGAITLTVDDVLGVYDGIDTRAVDGTTTITLGSTADVTGTTGAGIFSYSAGATGHITVQGMSGNVTGGTDGLDIDTMGADILVQNLDSVTGQAGDGIDAVSNGGDITIANIDTITGSGGFGVLTQAGAGNISIQGSGLVGGITGAGSMPRMVGGLFVNSGDGIYATANGSINIGSVAAIGNVTSVNGNGIFARSSDGNIVISANNVSSSGTNNPDIFAINARIQNGNGDISITTSGLVNSTGRFAGGVFATADTGDVLVDTNRVETTGEYSDGIKISANSTESNLTVTVGDISTAGSGSSGINVYGTASSVNITSTGTVSTSERSSRGIAAGFYSSDISILANEVITTAFNSTGISARTRDGDVAVIVTGSVSATGIASRAIDTAAAGSGNIAIDTSVAPITAYGSAIVAENDGSGSILIAVSDVTSGRNGIDVSNGYSSMGSVTIDSAAGSIVGANRGVYVFERGTGSISIATTDVTGTYADGIFAYSTVGGITVDSSAGTVTGGSYGINARNSGPSAVSVTSANVTGGFTGIFAESIGGSVTVDSRAGMVTGDEYGIFARDRGAGVVAVTAADVTGGTTGIDARADGSAVQISVAGDVSGGDNGIVSVSQNGTQLDVAAGSTVSGSTVGIATMASGGSATSNDILNILGSVNGAIMTFEGNDVVTLADGSSVNGAVMLGAGADTLNLDGGTMGMLRGGDDSDTLNFVGGGLITNSGDATDAIDEFETFNFNVGGYALGGTHQGLTTTNFNVGDTMLLGTLSSTNVNIATGGGLLVADGATINGNLNNMGNLGINAGGLGTLNINGNLTQSAGGTLTLDVVNGTSLDQIIVSGDVTLDGALVVNQSAFIKEDRTLIDGGTGLFGNFSSVSGLATDGLLVSQIVQLDRVNNDVKLSTSFTAATDIAGLTTNQIAVANSLVSQLRVGGLSGGLEDIALAIGSIGNANTLGNALDELQPEIVNGGIEVFRNSQMLFVRTLLNSSAPDFGSDPVETASLTPVAMNKSPDGPHIWGSIQYTNYEQSGDLTNLSFDTDGFEVVSGISNIEAGPISFGVAVGYAELDTIEDATGGDRVQTDLFRLGASAAIDLNQSNKGLQAHLDNAITAAFGSNDTTMNIAIPAIGLAVQQNGKADIDSLSIFSRLTLDGIGDKVWAIKPHLMVGYNKTSQDALTLGNGATALATQSGNFDRFTFGYGLMLEQRLNYNTAIKVGVSGVHHSDDTQSLLTSRFVAGGTGAQPFNTTGKSIRDQYLFETGLDQNLGNGWTASVNGYLEFGDLEGFGGLLKVGKRF